MNYKAEWRISVVDLDWIIGIELKSFEFKLLLLFVKVYYAVDRSTRLLLVYRTCRS